MTDTGFAADVLYLLLRGFYIADTEDPGLWTDERVGAAVSRLTDLFVAGLESRPEGTGGASDDAGGAPKP
ncbi:hypothetical protein [Streptosporangium sp. CA-115845]|uniref:hypothetical protein n=1 Tax=Streptosporangium sp. CA-115845 TaxID=3240071 RepID=UPI003D91523E